jgi:aminopeptidase YwaD
MDKRSTLKFFSGTLPLIMLFILFSCGPSRKVTVRELQDHVKYLSSDSLKGRLTGTAGDSLAAVYIRKELASNGFQPLAGDGFQRFKVTSKLVAGPENDLSVEDKRFLPEKDFMPFGFSGNAGLISEAIFAGYGFNINTDSLKWNDYQGIDVKNKWIIILRADPEVDNSSSPFIPFSADRDKALLAKDMGAAGVLMVSGAAFDTQDTFEALNLNDFSVEIPVLHIKREVADVILKKVNKTVAELEKNLNTSRKPQSFATKTMVSAKAEVVREMNTTRNVVMVLPGENDTLKNEYIIFGAHFDHLGMGGRGSGSRVPDTVAVHSGADDNASGVSMMLELAEEFAHTKGSHKRSIICIAFTGEEEGLLGSKYFVEHPGIDLTKVNAMVNLDMVGRLQDSSSLQISGIGTAQGLKELITSKSDTGSLKVTLSEEGYGPSDHSSFYGKNIPVLFFFTGAHTDYHTPADTYDKINYIGMVSISSLIFSVSETLASSSTRLQFKEAGPKVEAGRVMRKKMATLGIMPDFAGNVKNGLRADEVNPGRPAALGGMKKGDIIISINGKSVNNVYDYMSRMSQLKSGQIITVEVLRGGIKLGLLIKL